MKITLKLSPQTKAFIYNVIVNGEYETLRKIEHIKEYKKLKDKKELKIHIT